MSPLLQLYIYAQTVVAFLLLGFLTSHFPDPVTPYYCLYWVHFILHIFQECFLGLSQVKSWHLRAASEPDSDVEASIQACYLQDLTLPCPVTVKSYRNNGSCLASCSVVDGWLLASPTGIVWGHVKGIHVELWLTASIIRVKCGCPNCKPPPIHLLTK